MAKRKKRHTRSRRRVSGMNTDLKSIGLSVVGAVVASKLSAMLRKPKADGSTGTMAAIAPYSGILLGFVAPMISKDSTIKAIANGAMIGGALEALRALAPGIVSGVFTLPVISGRRRLGGGVQSPGMIGNGYTPARNSANLEGLSVISGTGLCN